MKEDEGFKHAMEYGNLWHEAEECHAAGGQGEAINLAIRSYGRKLREQYPTAEADINKWSAIAALQFPLYVDHWKRTPTERNRKPIWEEVSFRIPYTLPSGATVILRGKWDAVFASGKSIVNQENKTKGDIDELGITRTVDRNLQTMFYHVALRELAGLCKSSYHAPDAADAALDCVPSIMDAYPHFKDRTVKAILYNVIRRPLGDKYAIRQKKSETLADFLQRITAGIKEKPDHYFKRWTIQVKTADVTAFRERVLDPILEQLVDWWGSIKNNPFDPWRCYSRISPTTGDRFNLCPNPNHWQSPWGVYNSLAGGWRGDYFDLLTTGSTASLIEVDTVFPEL